MFVAGIICVVVALIWLCFKTYISYTSFGGTAHMIPVYDAAMYPPAMTAFGLFWILRGYEIHWPWWAFLLIWLPLTGLAIGIIRLAEVLGDRPL